MRGASVILVLLSGLVASVFVAQEEDEPPPPVPERLAAESGTPPAAPVARCEDSTTAAGPHDPIGLDDEIDKVVGPLRIVGLGLYEADWRAIVDDDQWMKAPALVEPRAAVTLVIPRAQRAWNHVSYGGRGGSAVTLRACARRTVFAGGFTIDYAKAPREGRCAELIVWGSGPAKRVRLFDSLC